MLRARAKSVRTSGSSSVASAAMLAATDSTFAHWNILDSNDKKRARLNGISHLLSLIPYEKPKEDQVKLPKRSKKDKYDDAINPNGRVLVPRKW